MDAYPAAEVARINELGDRLRGGLRGALAEASVAGTVTGYGSFVGLHLGPTEVATYRDAARANRDGARLLHLALLLEGVFCAPRLMWCASTAMDHTVVDEAVAAARRAVRRIAPALRSCNG